MWICKCTESNALVNVDVYIYIYILTSMCILVNDCECEQTCVKYK